MVGTKRVADGYNLLADISGLTVANFDWSKIFDVFDFDNGKIIDWVGADKFNIFISRTIVEDNANFGSISDDVLVSGDIAIATDDKASTGSLGNLTSKERTGGASVGDDWNYAFRDGIGNFGNWPFGKGSGVIAGRITTMEDWSSRTVVGIIKSGAWQGDSYKTSKGGKTIFASFGFSFLFVFWFCRLLVFFIINRIILVGGFYFVFRFSF